jgi:hypothetical protein
MGFERRHRNEAPGREDLAASLARAHHLEPERAREVLRRAEQAAAEDPQARPVQQWFAQLVEDDALVPDAGKHTQLARPDGRAAQVRAGRAGGRPAPGRQTLVMQEAQLDAEPAPRPAAPAPPRREPGRLDVLTQWRMSQAFGFDFSGVSIRRDSPEATGTTRALVKDGEVHFREGAYQPGTRAGDWLIAHELAHVVQQQGGRGDRPASRQAIEREADRAATLALLGRAAPIALRAQPAVAYAFSDGEAHADELDEDTASGADEAAAGAAEGTEAAEAAPTDAKAAATQSGEPKASATEAAEAQPAAVNGEPAHGPASEPGDGPELDAGGEDAADIDDAGPGAEAADGGGEAAGGAPGAGGGGGAPAKQEKAPNVAGARPEAGFTQLQGVRPDKLVPALGQLHASATADVGKTRAEQRANPPKQLSTGEAAASKQAGAPGSKADAAGGAAGTKAEAAAGAPGASGAKNASPGADPVDAPVKAEVPGGEAAKQAKQGEATQQQKLAGQIVSEISHSIASWFGSWFGGSAGKSGSGEQQGGMSEAETKQLSGSLDKLPTSASGVSTEPGPAPALAMKGEAKASSDAERARLEAKTAQLEQQGRADSRVPMGEDHIETSVPAEELTAKAVPGGATSEAALPTLSGAAPSEEVGIVAKEQHGAEIDAALAKASTDVTAERAKHAKEEEKARADADKQLRDLKTKADADQAAARAKAKAEADKARGEWQAEIDKQGADARRQADKKVTEGMAQVAAEEAKANAEAKQHIEEGKRKADEEKQKGEREAEAAKQKGKGKSSGFLGWLSSKAKAFFDGIKKAISAAIDAARKAVKAVIDAAKKLAMAAIELARKAITAAIKAIGDALLAISEVLLAAFPELKAKFQAMVRKAVDAATTAVNKIAEGLKKAVQAALDLLGAALDKALGLLEKGLHAIVDAAGAVVQGAIDAARAVVEALGTWARLIKDIASGPGAWIGKLGAAVVDGIKNHLWAAFKTAAIEWFKSKVFELLGIGGVILQILAEGGIGKDEIIQMALDALIVAIPAALIAILIEKLVSMIVPAAGAVMVIIEGLQAAWGTISRIIAAFAAFMAFLLAVQSGAAGPLFATALASAAVVLLDFVANWLLKKLRSAARRVGARLKGMAAKLKARFRGKGKGKGAKGQPGAKPPKKRPEPDKDSDKDKNKKEDNKKRLAEAARAIRPKLAALLAKQPSKLRVRGQLAVWKVRYRLSELRMEDLGRQVAFIAKVNPEEEVGKGEEIPLKEELKKAESPRTGFYFRGDDEWRPGQSVGTPLTEDTPLPEAEELIAHVHPKAKDEKKRTARGNDDEDAPTKTFVSFAEIIGTKTGGAAKFTKKNRISKVARAAIDKLVAEGKLRILTPEDVRKIIEAHPRAKIAREAKNVEKTMLNNYEILIQGLIPGDLLSPV